jgi:hypothetical protein
MGEMLGVSRIRGLERTSVEDEDDDEKEDDKASMGRGRGTGRSGRELGSGE